jgi:hypothetical protein
MSSPRPLREYMRVTPDRVPELEALGWHPAVASTFSDGQGVEIVMVREIEPAPTPPSAESPT